MHLKNMENFICIKETGSFGPGFLERLCLGLSFPVSSPPGGDPASAVLGFRRLEPPARGLRGSAPGFAGHLCSASACWAGVRSNPFAIWTEQSLQHPPPHPRSGPLVPCRLRSCRFQAPCPAGFPARRPRGRGNNGQASPCCLYRTGF